MASLLGLSGHRKMILNHRPGKADQVAADHRQDQHIRAITTGQPQG